MCTGKSTPGQLAEFLDVIAENLDECRNFMSGEVGNNTRMARLPVEALEEVMRPARGRIAADRLYDWLGIFSDDGCQLLDRDIARLRFDLEWDAPALKALIVHAVETCLGAGEDCADVIGPPVVGRSPLRLREVVHGNGGQSQGSPSHSLLPGANFTTA